MVLLFGFSMKRKQNSSKNSVDKIPSFCYNDFIHNKNFGENVIEQFISKIFRFVARHYPQINSYKLF